MPQDADNEDFTSAGMEKDLSANQRRTVRYIRRDIVAQIRKGYLPGALGLSWFKQEIKAKLLDLSNRGCLIRSFEKLALNEKISILLTFDTGKQFVIKGVVVREAQGRGYEYGVKFIEYNNELGEYMLKTQRELNFK